MAPLVRGCTLLMNIYSAKLLCPLAGQGLLLLLLASPSEVGEEVSAAVFSAWACSQSSLPRAPAAAAVSPQDPPGGLKDLCHIHEILGNLHSTYWHMPQKHCFVILNI